MNTTNFEGDNNLKVAEDYYSAMLKNDFDMMLSYLHENIHFIGPLAEMHGRDAVVSAALVLNAYILVSSAYWVRVLSIFQFNNIRLGLGT